MNDPNAVRNQLARILGSQTFLNAPSLRRFLEHLVEQVLAGNADHLKEYTLGLAVFDRKESFDPRTDTIVRVQARRLRAKLREYYENEGRADPIVIELPKGHYAASFRDAAEVDAGRPARAAKRRLLFLAGIAPIALLAVWAVAVWRGRVDPSHTIDSFAVLPLANLSGNVEEDYFAEGMTEALIAELARIRAARDLAAVRVALQGQHKTALGDRA